ncbi:MAG: HEAT repeat domain-containing protein [Cytophagales bacterium]|nr:HEAT repeat domain-containing protein [Cytophagales bacterium]
MKISEIEALLRRYDAGETSPEEEERLARYFTAGPTPPQWAGYAAQFGYFQAQGQETVPAEALFDRIPFEAPAKTLTAPRVIRLSWGLGLAASVSLLLTGFLAAWLLLRGGAPAVPQGDMVALQREVKEMKQLVMLSLLENQSASERIKAVSYAEALPALDPAVRDALVHTLDADQNPNVRLAAAEALGRFPESEEVRQALVGALEREPDAMLQITLIQLLVNMEEKRAARSIERLIRRDSTPEVVRKLARKGLNALKES